MGRETAVFNESDFRWLGERDPMRRREGVVERVLNARKVVFDLLTRSRRLRLNWRLVKHHGSRLRARFWVGFGRHWSDDLFSLVETDFGELLDAP
jgi:hypothetical protein